MTRFRKLFFTWLYWRGNARWDSGVSPPELLDFVETHPAGVAIDMGCGTGTNVITLAARGWDVTGIDFVPQAIRAAKRKTRAANIQADLRVGDVTQLEGLQKPADFILDMGCMHGVPENGRDRYIGHLNRLLKPGGTFMLYVFLREPAEKKIGLTESQITSLQNMFTLAKREDGGFDEHRSAWLTFVKPS